MKKGKMLKESKNIFVFVFILLFFVALIAIGYFSGFFEKITSSAVQYVGVNISVGVATIIDVTNGTATMTLGQGPLSTSRVINFTAYHGSGAPFLNESTPTVNITLLSAGVQVVGEVPRIASSCTKFSNGSNNITFSCNVTMWWFDGGGNWNITATIKDNGSNLIYNSTATLYVGATTGFEISPGNLTWSPLGAGVTNQSSTNDPLVLNNTGNQPVGNATGTSNISLNSTDVLGETNAAYKLYAENFSTGPLAGSCPGAACSECGGGYSTNLSYGNFSIRTNMTLPKGNYTKADGYTGQEQMYFCLRIVGADLIAQTYSTLNQPWTVKIY